MILNSRLELNLAELQAASMLQIGIGALKLENETLRQENEALKQEIRTLQKQNEVTPM